MIMLHEKELLEIEVAEYLFRHKNQWIITQDLKNELKIGPTVLRRIIERLSHHCSMHNIELNISKNKGIKINCGDDYPVQKIFETIYTSSLVYKIITVHFKEVYVSATQFALKNYISTTTLQREIRKINKAVSKYNIFLKRGKIVGDEEGIRKFLFTYLWSIHRKNIINILGLYEGKKLLVFLEEKTGLSLTKVGREKFLLYFSIINIRERKKNKLDSISPNIKLVSQFSNYFPELQKNFNYLYDKNSINLRFLLFLFLAFQDNYHNASALTLENFYKTLSMNFRQCNEKKKILSEEIDASILINYLVIDFEKRITLLYDRIETNEIILVVFSMCWQENIMFLDFIEENFFTCTRKIQDEFPYVFEELNIRIPSLNNEMARKIFLEALCAIFLKANISTKLGGIFYITIILTKGEIYEDIAKDILKKSLSYKYNLKFLPKNYSKKSDLIITDFPELLSENNELLFIRNEIISVNNIVKIDELLSKKKRNLLNIEKSEKEISN